MNCTLVTASGRRFMVTFASIVFLASTMSAQVHRCANEPGWVWQVEPDDASAKMHSTGGFVIASNELKSGDLLLTVAHSGSTCQDAYTLRAVGFDKFNRRFEFNQSMSATSNGLSLSTFIMPAGRLPADQLRSLGIEKLTYDSLRVVVAPKAARTLRQQGERALDYPVIGKPYEFELTTVAGTALSSRDYRGRVVLIDFWASWCTPCMAKMPRLRQIYAELHGKGFEVIGINHDLTLEQAIRAAKKAQLPWPEVIAAIGREKRDLWNTAAGISSLPRLWLIDRNGILQADLSIDDFEREIRKQVTN